MRYKKWLELNIFQKLTCFILMFNFGMSFIGDLPITFIDALFWLWAGNLIVQIFVEAPFMERNDYKTFSGVLTLLTILGIMIQFIVIGFKIAS